MFSVVTDGAVELIPPATVSVHVRVLPTCTQAASAGIGMSAIEDTAASGSATELR
jgi:hypothetical protein